MASEYRCAVCDGPFVPIKRWDKVPRLPQAYCSRPCANAGIARKTIEQRAEKMRGSGTGRTKYRKRNNRHEHRTIAEQKLGRSLLPGEIVHHINGNSHDNDPANLAIMTQAEHARIHSTKNRICDVPACSRKHAARGFCGMHYQRWCNGKEVMPYA